MPRSLKELQALVDRLGLEAGDKEKVHLGTYEKTGPSIPTGVLSLDVALGTNGWSSGAIIGIYGPKDIGKSVLALMSLANAQKMGKGCAYIAYEQKWSPKWVKKFEVDPEQVIVLRPNSVELAFDQMYKLLKEPIIDFVVFDSLGATLTESELEGTATGDAKAKLGGQSGAITHGIKRLPFLVWKGQKTVILLNQVRQVITSLGQRGYKQPGGEALEHHEEVIVQLKNGTTRYEVKDPGGKGSDKILYGQEVVAVIERSQRTEGSKIAARYDFYNKAMEGHEVGVDKIKDILNTARRLGVFTFSGSWFEIPGVDKKFQEGGFVTYLNENPKEEERIREIIYKAVK